MKHALFITALLMLGAADPAEVEALIKQGVELRKAGKDVEALKKFEEAFAKGKTPRARAQMGLAQQALGAWVEAEVSLKAAIAANDPWITKNNAALAAALSEVQKRLGSVEIISTVPGAQIFVNGEPVGKTPLKEPLRVVAGSLSVELALDGYWPLSRTVVVPAGGLARETMKLVPKPGAAPIAEKPPVVEKPVVAQKPPVEAAPLNLTPTAAITADTKPTTAEAQIDRGGGNKYGTVGWISAGVGGAGLIAGVIGLVLRESHASKWNSDECLPNNGTTRQANCGDELSAAEGAQTISTVGFIGGGLGLAGAALFLFVLGDSSENTASLQVSGDSLVLRGKF